MIRNSFSLSILIFCATFLLWPFSMSAAGLSLSVTPTLFEVSAVPGQSFRTSIKVINGNDVPITVYAEPQNFAPRGERGHSSFIPLFESVTDGTTLGEWMEVPNTPLVIEPGQTRTVPVSIAVPADATPGGHYAAVMIGTKPPAESGSLEVRTSQVISSLFFVRIAGDVIEKGTVRTFRSLQNFTQTPEMSFEVRFQNDGNVHLQPQGEIVITNMWGKERGIIPINHKTHFGNVLPDSIRQYEFSWAGEASLSDFGRYTAKLTLGYGLESRKFTSQSTSFWVVPVKPLLIIFAVLGLLIWFVTKMVKAYIRRMLLISGIDPDAPKERYGNHRVALVGDVAIPKSSPSSVSVDTPLRAGFADFKNRFQAVSLPTDRLAALGQFIRDYRWFFAAVIAMVALLTVLVLYVMNATTDQRDYQVVIENPNQSLTISSEEIIADRQVDSQTEEVEEVVTESDQPFSITIINSSDTPGNAALLKDELEALGYRVDKLNSDLEKGRNNSVVVYDPAHSEAAIDIAKAAGGALPSSFVIPLAPEDKDTIVIYLGNDYE